jgi:pre-mRNA-splicing factor 38A
MSHKDPSLRADASLFLDDRGYSGHLIRGQPPHLLFEEAVRNRIIDSYYWKEQCFGLNAATLCDRAVDLTFIGGTYNDGQRPTPFLCLAFKMLQLNIDNDVLDCYLQEGGEDFKYLRALAAFYIRLTSESSEEVYKRLEPWLEDFRKLRRRGNGGFSLTTVDGFVDELMTRERVCGTSFWKLVGRQQLEDEDRLEERVSPLQWMVDQEEEDGEVGDVGAGRDGDGSSGEDRVNGDEANGRHEEDE